MQNYLPSLLAQGVPLLLALRLQRRYTVRLELTACANYHRCRDGGPGITEGNINTHRRAGASIDVGLYGTHGVLVVYQGIHQGKLFDLLISEGTNT